MVGSAAARTGIRSPRRRGGVGGPRLSVFAGGLVVPFRSPRHRGGVAGGHGQRRYTFDQQATLFQSPQHRGGVHATRSSNGGNCEVQTTNCFNPLSTGAEWRDLRMSSVPGASRGGFNPLSTGADPGTRSNQFVEPPTQRVSIPQHRAESRHRRNSHESGIHIAFQSPSAPRRSPARQCSNRGKISGGVGFESPQHRAEPRPHYRFRHRCHIRGVSIPEHRGGVAHLASGKADDAAQLYVSIPSAPGRSRAHRGMTDETGRRRRSSLQHRGGVRAPRPAEIGNSFGYYGFQSLSTGRSREPTYIALSTADLNGVSIPSAPGAESRR